MAEARVETLLGAWIEQVRRGRLQRMADVVEATGVSLHTLMSARRSMRRPYRATLAALGEYLMVDDPEVAALWQMPATYDAPDMRAQQRRMSGQLSKLAQVLDEVRTERGHTLTQVTAKVMVSAGTMVTARRLDPGMRAGTWGRLADYVGLSVEECKALAASPAVRVMQTYPVETWNGVKWHPTVPCVSCVQCPFRESCMRDVDAGDFAWCEDVIPEDFQPS